MDSSPVGSPSAKKLERRLAKKISDFDSSFPPSSASSPSRFPPPPLRDSSTSFRVTGIHSGEFQKICEILGIAGGPDAFAISVADWESGKLHISDRRKSSSDLLTSSLFPPATRSSGKDAYSSATLRGRGARIREDRRLLFEDVSTSDSGRRTGDLDRRTNSGLNDQTRTSRGLEVLGFHSSSISSEQLSEEADTISIGNEHTDFVVCDTDNDEINESNEISAGSGIKQHDGRLDIERVSENSDVYNGINNNHGITVGHSVIEHDGSLDMGRVSKNSDATQLPLRPPPSMRLKTQMPILSTYELLKSFGPDQKDDNDDIYSSDMSNDDKSSQDDSDTEECNVLLEDSKERVPEIKENKRQEGFVKSQPMPVEDIKESVREIKATKLQEGFVKSQPMPVSKVLTRKASATIVSRSDVIIHSWRKLDVLGSGSFGTVYEGLSEEGIYFAVKEVHISPGDRRAQQCVEQLEQEIRFLSKFRHENIIRYLGSERDSSKIYIFLELATKGSISSLIRKYALYDPQIKLYTRQILKGLKYLHDQGIVHRDIKCSNILVDIHGKVKVADFGLAIQVSNLNELKSCKGSAYWMAPEVIQPTTSYSFPADIWSLGCTVLEMMTRQPPFGGIEWHQALWKVARGEVPPIPDNLSEDANDFIRSCLQVDPSRRPVADQLLQHPFVQNITLTPRNSFS